MNRAFFASTAKSFRAEFDGSGDRLAIPIRLRWHKIAWVSGATIFGVALHYYQSVRDTGDRRLELVIIVVTILFFLLGVLASRFAEEFVQIGNGKLLHGWRLFGLRRIERYDIGEVRGLGFPLENFSSPREQQDDLISLRRDFGKRGALKFDTETKSVYIGMTLSEEDAGEVLTWLTRRLPHRAIEY